MHCRSVVDLTAGRAGLRPLEDPHCSTLRSNKLAGVAEVTVGEPIVPHVPPPWVECTAGAWLTSRTAEPTFGLSRIRTAQRYDRTSSPEWRNWQTRGTQNPVSQKDVWVRPPPPAS